MTRNQLVDQGHWRSGKRFRAPEEGPSLTQCGKPGLGHFPGTTCTSSRLEPGAMIASCMAVAGIVAIAATEQTDSPSAVRSTTGTSLILRICVVTPKVRRLAGARSYPPRQHATDSAHHCNNTCACNYVILDASCCVLKSCFLGHLYSDPVTVCTTCCRSS